MKILKTKKLLFAAMIIISIMTACKKEKMIKDAAGNYLCSGNTPAGLPFVNQVISVTKVSKNRLKIEPVGNTYITAFEVNIMRVGDKLVSEHNDDDHTGTIDMSSSPYTIGFSTENPEQTFAGTKQ